MQLMVVGDKWEMYIPMELAYGPNGKPPKIPPAATLIFIMEIVKIKGETTPRLIEFPEWTPEELALWLDKDEAACQSWRGARAAKWEAGDAKLTETYPTREELDAWLDKQCLSSKNKSLWKRTRAAKKKATAAPAAAAPAAPAALTVETGKVLLTRALDTFHEPANKAKLVGIVKECDASGDASQAGMMKMMKLMPAVQGMMGTALQEFGFGPDDLMTVATQLMSLGPQDPFIAEGTAKLMKAVQGDLSDFV